MKKRILFLALFTFFVFFANAQITPKYYYGLGKAGAIPLLPLHSIDFYYNRAWNTLNVRRSPCGSLSKIQSALLWKVLSEYNYRAGDMFQVQLIADDCNFIHVLVVQIEADGSCTWKGFCAYTN